MIKNKVTLKDIAVETGFSLSAVDHALKNRNDISEKTKKIIQSAAQRMGYVTNAQASALRTGATKTIAVITASVANPFFSILVQEIEKCAFEKGYNVLIFNTYGQLDIEEQKIQQALAKNVDGIIISPAMYQSSNIEMLRTINTPYITIGRSNGDDNVSYVTVDDEKGGYPATKHLLDADKRRVLYLTSNLTVPSARYRLAGYKRALLEAGIPFNGELVQYVDLNGGSCKQVLKSLQDKQIQYDSIFCFNDMIAYEVFYQLYDSGVRVPDQIGLIGFDNIQEKILVSIPLDSIGTLKESIGSSSVNALIAHIADPNRPVDHLVLDVGIYDRNSTSKKSAT